jgi:hypothetical protein
MLSVKNLVLNWQLIMSPKLLEFTDWGQRKMVQTFNCTMTQGTSHTQFSIMAGKES